MNKHDYHYQTTLLHEVAAGTGDENRICIPIREVIDTHRIRFIKDTVVEIQKDKQLVIINNGDPITFVFSWIFYDLLGGIEGKMWNVC